MKEKSIRLSDIVTNSVYIVYILLFSVLLLNFFVFRDNIELYGRYVRAGFLMAIIPGFLILLKLSAVTERFANRTLIIALVSICFVFKLIWVLAYRILPAVDYKTYFETAAELSENVNVTNPHIALFPHLMGYALFLSVFFKTIGVYYLVPPLLNVFLTSVSAALLYYICYKIGNKKTAVICCTLWILNPSQTIYNSLTLSEPLYCTVLLFIWALFIYIGDRFYTEKTGRLAVYAVAAAFLLELFNMMRPLGPIVIIALIVWLAFTGNHGLPGERPRPRIKAAINKTVFIAVVVIGYLLFSMAARQYLTLRLGQPPASLPGYNIYVGFNEQSVGRWNAEDAGLLYHYSDALNMSAENAQRQMFEQALLRIGSSDNLLEFLYDKFIVFLGDDSAAVFYTAPVLNHPGRLSVICNVYYYFIIGLSVFGASAAIKRQNRTPLILICLYGIGLIMAQLLVEVAPRYHYSIALTMMILASYGVSILKAAKTAAFPKDLQESPGY